MARQAEQDPTNLYIANLPHSIKENDLEAMFSPFGQVRLRDRYHRAIFERLEIATNRVFARILRVELKL